MSTSTRQDTIAELRDHVRRLIEAGAAMQSRIERHHTSCMCQEAWPDPLAQAASEWGRTVTQVEREDLRR